MNKLNSDLKKDFPFVYDFDYAIVYSKEKVKDWEFSDDSEEIEESEYESSILSKGTRIGILNCWDDDIGILIVFTSDTIYYSNDGSMTNDGVSFFKLSENVHYCPAQEPVDLLESDFENGGGTKLKKHIKLELISKEYELNHFLISA